MVYVHILYVYGSNVYHLIIGGEREVVTTGGELMKRLKSAYSSM